MDVWYSPCVAKHPPEVRVKRLSNEKIEITRIAEPKQDFNANTVDVHYTIIARDIATNTTTFFEEVHRMRHFSLPEITLLAEMHDFSVVQVEEFGSGKTPSADTWGVCFVLRKS